MFRSRSWFGGSLWRNKNPHSLEHLKYLHNVLSKNQTVSENNRGLLVETLRSIAEILIWGDQNDSSVFDFFLEKNMLSFFLKILKQKCGSYVCVQLLQTLNILFENIRNETSLYYLLSNNHVNSIIVHKFDFSDEEVMAYYISFLKTLSLKLNSHTIHFFYNDHTNDFPLYTEAIKFFKHPESMVRIAVRTLTLNVYKVQDHSMLKFIRNKTAAPYFSNLVWFIGNHVLELDICVRNDADKGRLKGCVTDQLLSSWSVCHLIRSSSLISTGTGPKVNFIKLLCRPFFPMQFLNNLKRIILKQNWFIQCHNSHTLTIRLPYLLGYIAGHLPWVQCEVRVGLALKMICTIVSNIISISMTSIMNFIVIFCSHSSQSRLADLVAEHLDHLHYLNDILCLNIDDLNDVLIDHLLNKLLIPLYIFSLLPQKQSLQVCFLRKARVSSVVSLFLLSQVFLITRQKPLVNDLAQVIIKSTTANWENGSFITNVRPVFDAPSRSLEESLDASSLSQDVLDVTVSNVNITDEEKEQRLAQGKWKNYNLYIFFIDIDFKAQKVFLEVIVNSLDCVENDYAALFALCLLYAISQNNGIDPNLLEGLLIPSEDSEGKPRYNNWIVQKLIHIINISCQATCKVRLVTLELATILIQKLVMVGDKSYLSDAHFAVLMGAKEESASLLRNYYKREDMFGEMFESEDEELRKKPINVEWLMMDSNVLLPPTGTPMTGIEFGKRLPCGEVERARRAIRVFLLVRGLCLKLSGEKETQLPLTNRNDCVQNDTVLDLTNSDLLSCHVIGADGVRNHRFLVVESNQIILVVPVPGQLGFGRPKLAAMLHDLDVSGDKQDSRSLYISAKYTTVGPMINTKFIFDDSIRCMAAQQRLSKGRMKSREEKMRQMEKLLDIPASDSPPYNLLQHKFRIEIYLHKNLLILKQLLKCCGRSMFSHRIPGFATPIRVPPSSPKNGKFFIFHDVKVSENSNSSGTRSRDNSPKLPRPRSEEIQLENMLSKRNSVGTTSLITQEEHSAETEASSSQIETPGPSRETSFTESSDTAKRKGMVETV
uniref:FPL domain-containing protein n=1 Tax=Rhodnius prolixus TaxID=13249 RepID=T1HT72_RHOPR